MDKTRAKRMAAELEGKSVAGWLIGPYLGNGFSALVLQATKAGQEAAIKLIDPEMVERSGTEKQLARILREKDLAGHGHPNLVDIIDGGQCSETEMLYVVMELLSSKTLGQSRNKLPRHLIGTVISQLARAAQYLETRGIMHRDIKPDNATITADFSTVKLLDLGVISPPADPSDPSAGTGDRFVGTARYSPPEFLYREDEHTPDARRAITFYQLGATLYDLLMRRPIFDEFREPPARLYQAVKEQIPVIDCDDVEPWLVDLARKCLHKDWRVRKELVGWNDFQGPPPLADSADEIRARLARRFQTTGAISRSPTQTTGMRPPRRILFQLAGALATIARDICRQGAVFPAVEVRNHIESGLCVVVLNAGPSTTHDLGGILQIKLIAEALDAQATHVKIRGSARLGAEASADEAQSSLLFTGEFSDPKLREVADVYLHATLERALGTGTPPGAGLAVRPDMKGS